MGLGVCVLTLGMGTRDGWPERPLTPQDPPHFLNESGGILSSPFLNVAPHPNPKRALVSVSPRSWWRSHLGRGSGRPCGRPPPRPRPRPSAWQPAPPPGAALRTVAMGTRFFRPGTDERLLSFPLPPVWGTGTIPSGVVTWVWRGSLVQPLPRVRCLQFLFYPLRPEGHLGSRQNVLWDFMSPSSKGDFPFVGMDGLPCWAGRTGQPGRWLGCRRATCT